MSGLLRLYPRPWRERYGEEFEALLADRPPTLRHRLDIVRGALDARVHPEIVDPSHQVDRWWLAPLLGFAMFIVALALLATGPVQYDEYGSYRDGSAAALPWVVAMLLLLTGIARTAIRAPEGAAATKVAGSIAVASGLLFCFSPWGSLISLTFFGAIIAMMIGAARAGVVPAWIPVLLGITLLPVVLAFATTLLLPWYTLREADVSPLLILVPLGMIWPIVTLGLLVGSQPTRRPGSTLAVA
jgi:hypothetical protein